MFFPRYERLQVERAGGALSLRTGSEGQEGISAFLETRKPAWIEGDR